MIPNNKLVLLNNPTFNGIIGLLAVVIVVSVAGQESNHRKCAQHFSMERLIEQ